MQPALPNLKEIKDAAGRIAGVASRTPLVESPALSRLTRREVYLKLECFQPTRVFKIRGAYNKISRVKERGVVAASSGNHGIAVAYSSRILGKEATVVVPENAVKEKLETIEDLGAQVVKFGRLSGEREERARNLAKQKDACFIHPYNDPDVIAGQGTCGLEIIEQLETFDSVLVPVGGGGLISGISIVMKASRPRVKLYGVEPASAPKLSAALRAGKVVSVESPGSIADGLMPSALGELTFAACLRNVDGAFTATEDEILRATRIMAREAKTIAEPSGAAPLAPLLRRGGGPEGKKVVLVVSGGNMSFDILSELVS